MNIKIKIVPTGIDNPHIVLGKDLLENVVYEYLGSRYHMREDDDVKYYYKKDGKLFYHIIKNYDDILQESLSPIFTADHRFVARPDLKFEMDEDV